MKWAARGNKLQFYKLKGENVTKVQQRNENKTITIKETTHTHTETQRNSPKPHRKPLTISLKLVSAAERKLPGARSLCSRNSEACIDSVRLWDLYKYIYIYVCACVCVCVWLPIFDNSLDLYNTFTRLRWCTKDSNGCFHTLPIIKASLPLSKGHNFKFFFTPLVELSFHVYICIQHKYLNVSVHPHVMCHVKICYQIKSTN